MHSKTKSRKSFVSKLGDDNRNFYGTQDGRGTLRVIELAFDHSWIYLYELAQNALDAGASSIAIRIAEDGDALVFQHNGNRQLNKKDVEGLSKVFRSTKGARSVGFMGIGFKSVFMRFQEVRVSGWGWTFRYEIKKVVGEKYRDIQRDLLGAVIPIWDDAITAPDDGFTTRFEMRRRTDRQMHLKFDLVRFLPDDDRALLPILAMFGLERLEIDGRILELRVREEPYGSFEATALSENENQRWRIFSVQFKPSREAIACFLEHRRIQPSEDDSEHVYSDVTQARRVLGVLPLDNEGIPAPPTRGRVYATLPTEVTLPFGLHINADWLLDISRSGLREIEDNPWQRDIVDKIADILARFLEWSASMHSQPDAVKAAFKVLGLPSLEASGLESLLAEERWLSTLQDRLKDAAVIPVWADTTGELAYAKPDDTLVPPLPLARAFGNQPELSPAVLLSGCVLMDHVLERKAVGLLRRIGILTEMSPQELEGVWSGGLEDWWNFLPGDQKYRRKLLFRLWAAFAELSSEDTWENLNVRCVRSVTGEWFSVDDATFLSEPLPTEKEPGGLETRRILQRVIKDKNRLDSDWVAMLYQVRGKEPEREYLSQAWEWIQSHARSINLRDILKEALNTLMSSKNPDWKVLVPLGQWAKHRNRADLVTHVLVLSSGTQQCALTEEALLADPYVENGQDRRHLFSGIPVVVADYVERDPKNSGTYEWRTFFEKAGAKGNLVVRESKNRASRYDRQKVAKFLGCEIGAIAESNNNGYTLLDFDIKPNLPSRESTKEQRAALATWIEDGYKFLRDKGKRRTSYFFHFPYNNSGNKVSRWVKKLTKLAWVPCNDDNLRCPRDVLSQRDPAREDAPYADLSLDLISVLDQEGVKFGTAIPEVTSLRKLLAVGSELNALELAELLSECRQLLITDKDRQLFDQALQNLRLSTSNNRRDPIDQIVKRVGRPLRGTLGGWVVPLDDVEENLRKELEHTEFPRKFPETTTGGQALDYILHVWRRAQLSPERLANEVRDVLPTAYAYCLEDITKDNVLSKRWHKVKPQAMVFTEGKWIALESVSDIYFDDIEDRRYFPRQAQLQTVTGGHLGHSRLDQLHTAKEIGLTLLSSIVTMDWIGGDKTFPACEEWASRFKLICDLLRKVRGSDLAEGVVTDNETEAGPRLICVKELALVVSVWDSTAQRVPVNARLHEGTLTVAGCPVQFGADAAKELLRHFSFGQRASLAADLTGMLIAIENSDFNLAVEKFRRSHVPDFELPALFQCGLDINENDRSRNGTNDETTETTESKTEASTDEDTSSGQVPASSTSESDGPDSSGSETPKDNNTVTSGESGSKGGSYDRKRALAKQKELARQLKSALKGEIMPDPEEGEAVESAESSEDTDKSLGDEEYREVAAQYEREAGREPELGDPRQSGWDIRSTNLETEEVRYIEVKGRGCLWDNDEVVELSRAQIRKAFEEKDYWYLYVVEKVDNGCYRVLPIENPTRVAAKWILSGESWRAVAQEAKVVDSSSN